MSDLERVTNVLREHQVSHSSTAEQDRCATCGPLTPEFAVLYDGIQDRARTHQAAMLAAAGLVVTGTEWGLKFEPRRWTDGKVMSYGEDETGAKRQVTTWATPATVVQRGVTEWRTL